MKGVIDFMEILTENPVFESEAVFRRKLKGYVKHCSDENNRRLPNAAGFCRYAGITRSDFFKLSKAYPLIFDIAQSTFLDEALNTKIPNSAAYMSFIAGFNDSIGKDERDQTVRVILEHDPESDGV